MAWARENPIDMFNKNILRAKVVQGCVETASCRHFIETGTYHAATAMGAQRYLGLPVRSCEIDPRNYLISRAVTWNMPGITLCRADSPNFLRQECARLKSLPGACPFFYLDAHENELDLSSLPLEEEVRAILSLPEFVAMVDDFRVPQVESFEARSYAGKVIDVGLIKDLLQAADIHTCHFPAYGPADDTGYPSGYGLFWRSRKLDRIMENPPFPLNLLRPYSLAEEKYTAGTQGL